MSNQKEKQGAKSTQNAQTIYNINGQHFEGCSFQGITFQTLVQQSTKEESHSPHGEAEHEARGAEAGEEEDSYCEPEESSVTHLTSRPESAESVRTGGRELPADLRTSEARKVMAKMVREGFIDKEWQPVSLSLAEKGVLAAQVSDKLGITTPWKTFGSLWNVKSESLRVAQSRGIDQDKTRKFLARVKKSLD